MTLEIDFETRSAVDLRKRGVERWLPVVGFEGFYEVSDLGNVRSLYTGNLLTPGPHPGGYLLAHLYVNGHHTARTIHSLVLTAFVGPRPPKQEALHDNHVRSDNRLSNLRWGTKRQNEDAKIAAGRSLRGEAGTGTKLTVDQVLAIRRKRGVPQQELADEYGCTFSNISAIQRRKSWRHV